MLLSFLFFLELFLKRFRIMDFSYSQALILWIGNKLTKLLITIVTFHTYLASSESNERKQNGFNLGLTI